MRINNELLVQYQKLTSCTTYSCQLKHKKKGKMHTLGQEGRERAREKVKELGKREAGGRGKKEELRAVQDPLPPSPPSTLSPCGVA